MNCRLRSAILCIAIAAVFADCLSAAIISRDFIESGDGLLTYDTECGREWLDILATYGITVEGIADLLSPGRTLEGFHLATLDDMRSLALSAGFDRIDTQWGVIQDFAVAHEFINAVSGVFLTGGILGDTWYTTGLISDGLSTLEFQHVSVMAHPREIPPALNPPLYNYPIGEIWTTREHFRNYPINPALGFWLYRDSVVPEPTALWLNATALCLLTLRSRRRRSLTS